VRSIDFVFEAADGRMLAGTAWEPARVEGAVVVASATGVPRRIYAALAVSLAEAGLAVLTFDYRGIGDSRDRSLRSEPARMEDWGRLDLEGALGWMRQQHPRVPLLVLGHSAGGQLIGLAPSARQLAGALTVGAQLGWAGHWPWPARGLMLACWYVLIPALARVVGYLPMAALGQGENLPRGVALQWAAWGRRRHYLFDGLGPEVRARYASLTFPLRAVHIGDDGYAPRSGVAALAAFYGGPRDVISITPDQVGTRGIGHFGWVRSRFQDTIWKALRDWLLLRVRETDAPPGPQATEDAA
jgi:predicted alpha/beta hydrolase